MKKIVTKLLLFSLLLTVFASNGLMAQKKGEFFENIPMDGESRKTAFLVPTNYSSSKKYTLIIGMHPGGNTPPEFMRDMMKGAANQLGAILACPQDFQYNGTVLPYLYDYCIENYNIDLENVIITGYSQGGGATFTYGLANQDKIRGIIGVAPSYGYMNYEGAKEMPIGFIVGTGDNSFLSLVRRHVEGLEAVGGLVKSIEVQGVGHTGGYYYGPLFTSDWIECYNFIQSVVPAKPPVALVYPENDSKDIGSSVDLLWHKSEGAIYYELEVYDEIGSKVREAQTSDTTFQLNNLEPNETFFWKIREVSDGGGEAWSAMWRFTTMEEAPDKQVVLSEPEDEADDQPLEMSFVWEKSEEASIYHFQLSADNFTTYLVDDSKIVNVHNTVPDLDPETEYQWRVKAINSAGEGPWNEGTFTTQLDKPTLAVALSEPSDGSADMDYNITFTWATIEKALWYEFQLFLDGVASPQVSETNLETTDDETVSFNVHDILESKENYTWRVRGVNKTGDGPWSDVYSFSTGEFTSVSDMLISNGNVLKSKAYPNPAQNETEIKFESSVAGDVQLEIYDINGNTLYTSEMLIMNQGDNLLQVDLSNFVTGSYIYQIRTEKIIEYGKVVVNK